MDSTRESADVKQNGADAQDIRAARPWEGLGSDSSQSAETRQSACHNSGVLGQISNCDTTEW